MFEREQNILGLVEGQGIRPRVDTFKTKLRQCQDHVCQDHVCQDQVSQDHVFLSRPYN